MLFILFFLPSGVTLLTITMSGRMRLALSPSQLYSQAPETAGYSQALVGPSTTSASLYNGPLVAWTQTSTATSGDTQLQAMAAPPAPPSPAGPGSRPVMRNTSSRPRSSAGSAPGRGGGTQQSTSAPVPAAAGYEGLVAHLKVCGSRVCCFRA